MQLPPLPVLHPGNPWPPASVEDIATLWRAHATMEIDFTDTGEIPPQGERGGIWVMSPAFPGRKAYMKPRKIVKGEWGAVAAREKIASDLAHDLGVHVPPAVLATRRAVVGEERMVVLSLRLFEAQSEWSDVKLRIQGRLPAGGYLNIGELARQAAPREAARAFAFDWWLNQLDHGEFNTSNIAFGTHLDDSNAAFLFFDYEKSMGFGDAVWQGMTVPPAFPRELVALMDREELQAAAERIHTLSSSTVEEVVTRVPESYIGATDRAQLLENLLLRKVSLPSAVHTFLTEVSC